MTTLYQYEISPFCDKIRRILNIKQVPYRVENVTVLDTLKGRIKKLSPAAKLPVLDIDGQRIADSTDIALFLDARYPEPPLIPRDPRERAMVHVLEDWADESLYFYEVRLRLTVPHNARRWIPEVVKEDGAFIKAIAGKVMPVEMRKVTHAQGVGRKTDEAVRTDLERHFNALERLLDGNDWLVGKAITLADIAVFAQMHCLAGTVEGADLLRGFDSVRAWMARVDAATAAGT